MIYCQPLSVAYARGGQDRCRRSDTAPAHCTVELAREISSMGFAMKNEGMAGDARGTVAPWHHRLTGGITPGGQ